MRNFMLQSVKSGALAGFSAGLVYGIVELSVTAAVPWLRSGESELLPWQWPLIGMLFAVYAVAGLICGAAGAAWLARGGRPAISREQAKSLACLILSLAFTMNLAKAWPLTRSEYVALALSATLTVAFFAALRSPFSERRTAFLASPAIVSILLLIGPWVSLETLRYSPPLVKTGVSLTAMAAVFGFALIRQRFIPAPWARRAWTATAVALFGLLWLHQPQKTTAAAPVRAAAAQKPNIVLIVMDTVRADHLSLYGYSRPTSPYLEQLAREATVYNHVMATYGYTTPTHASLFTGLYASWHGATVLPDYPLGAPLAPRTRTLASVLHDHGYWTAATVANYVGVGPSTGLLQGFDAVEYRSAERLSDAGRPFYLRQSAEALLGYFVNTDLFYKYLFTAEDINRKAFAFLEQAGDSHRPFFLFLNYMDAHGPYVPPPSFRNRFAGGPPPGQNIGRIWQEVNAGSRPARESEKRFLESRYDTGIVYMDFEIQKLMTRLRELGLYDNTLVAITSDHGEAFGEHNRMTHAIGSVYEDQIDVPLVIKYPGQHTGSRDDALASEVDFMPTVLDSVSIPVPRGLQGRSLLRQADASSSGAVFAEGTAMPEWQENQRLRGTRVAVRSGDWKLIAWSAGKPELYNLAADSGELHNLYRPDDPVAQALEARLNAWASTMPRRSASHAIKPVDPEVLNKLRSLGYAK